MRNKHLITASFLAIILLLSTSAVIAAAVRPGSVSCQFEGQITMFYDKSDSNTERYILKVNVMKSENVQPNTFCSECCAFLKGEKISGWWYPYSQIANNDLPSVDVSKVLLKGSIIRGNMDSYDHAITNVSLVQEGVPFGDFEYKSKVFLYELEKLAQLIIFLLVPYIISSLVTFFISSAYFARKKIPKKALISVMIAHTICFIALFLLISQSDSWLGLLLMPFIPPFSLVFQAFFIHLLNKDLILLKRAFMLSFMINLAYIMMLIIFLISMMRI